MAEMSRLFSSVPPLLSASPLLSAMSLSLGVLWPDSTADTSVVYANLEVTSPKSA